MLDTKFLFDLLVVDRTGSDNTAIGDRMIDNGRIMAKMSAKNRQDVETSLDELMAQGYTTCGNCF